MNKGYQFIAFLVCSVMCVGVLRSADTSAADALYLEGHHEAALSAYEQIEHPSASVLSRMGQCALILKKSPQALLYWYRGLQRQYWLSYCLTAAHIAELEAQMGIRPEQRDPVWYITTACAAVPPLLWQLLLLLIVFLCSWFAGAWLRARHYGLLMLCSVVGLVLLWCAWQSNTERNRVDGIVLVSATLRSGPDERFAALGSIAAGFPVTTLGDGRIGEGAAYYKIRAGGKKGWVLQGSLALI